MLSQSQVDDIARLLSPRNVRFIHKVDERFYHVRSSSPLGRDVFMGMDYAVLPVTPCPDLSTFEPILNAWLGDDENGDGEVTSISFISYVDVAFITYNGYGIDGLWTFVDTAKLMKGEIVQIEKTEVYSMIRWQQTTQQRYDDAVADDLFYTFLGADDDMRNGDGGE